MLEYPKPWLLFWAAVIIAHFYMDYSLVRKWRSWKRGMKQPGARTAGLMKAARIWVVEVFLQRQLFALSRVRWFVHILIFYGFLGLLFLSLFTAAVKLLAYLGVESEFLRFFLSGNGYLLTKIWGDSFGTALLAGLLAASVKRLFFRDPQQDNKQVDVFLLILLLWLTVTGFVLEAARLSAGNAEFSRYSFFAHMMVAAGLVDQLRPWLTALWAVHAFSVAGMLFYLPHSKLMHAMLAPVVIAMNAVEEQQREDMYWPDVRKHRAT